MNELIQEEKIQDVLPIEILVGEAVIAHLNDPDFAAEWDSLCESCDWATVFQSRQFVSPWYKLYNQDYLPVLVKATSRGKLCGLLTLAQDKAGRLVGAGANQAEYQVWLLANAGNMHFIKTTFKELRNRFPGCTINLKFLPVNTPLGWINTDPVWERTCLLRSVQQPLLVIDKDKLALELRKKNRREKINRLKRLGELKFERVTDPQLFESVLDELTVQSDFRKGAMYNKTAFQDEPIRKEFLKTLFEQGLLHTTLFQLSNEIIASNLSVMGKNWVHLQGINTHSPMLAKHSPGILHFLMLGNMLAEEGVEVFDLTPGTDPYKGILATDYTIAYELHIADPATVIISKTQLHLNQLLKNRLPKLGLEQNTARRLKYNFHLFVEKAKLIKNNGIRPLRNTLVSYIGLSQKDVLLRYAGSTSEPITPVQIMKDSLSDLLQFNSNGSLTTKWEFLMDAMKRFEGGQHVYTWREGNCLKGCAWLSENPASQNIGIQDSRLHENAVLLHSFYYRPETNSRIKDFLKAISMVYNQSKSNNPLYARLSTNDKTLVEALKQAGFDKSD